MNHKWGGRGGRIDKDQLDDSGTTERALSAVKPIAWTGAGALLALGITWLMGGL